MTIPRHLYLNACAAVAFFAVGNCHFAVAEQLDEVIKDYWEFRVSSNPQFATRTGDHRFNDQLGEVSLRSEEKKQATRKQLLKRAKALDSVRMEDSDKVNCGILQLLLENDIQEFNFKSHLIPITNRSGFHIDFPDLRVNVPLNSVEDFENYIARLSGFQQYAKGHIELMGAGVNEGYTLPAVVLEGFDEPIKTHLVEDVEQTLFYEPFTKLPDSFDDETKSRLQVSAKKAIQDSVIPGYREFLSFMSDTYVPKAREAIGASALPQGREYYRYCVKKFTTLDLLPEEVHQTGQQEVKRIRAEMKEIIKAVEFEGDFTDFLEYLRTDPRFYAESPGELLKEVAIVLKNIDGKLPKLFKTLPRAPYGIRQVPDYIAPRTTTAYYMQPAGDGTEAGFYYVNTFNLKSRPLYEVEALSRCTRPCPAITFRLHFNKNWKDCPSSDGLLASPPSLKVGHYTPNDLGWRSVSTRTRTTTFGRLTYEMWRACRLVVDTGMHYLGWTRQQAIDFMAENTGLSLHNIRAEVDRYIAWPGQALGYKIGELKIRELRERAEGEMGDRFDIREFHDVVLGAGSVPLALLEQRVDEYIGQ